MKVHVSGNAEADPNLRHSFHLSPTQQTLTNLIGPGKMRRHTSSVDDTNFLQLYSFNCCTAAAIVHI